MTASIRGYHAHVYYEPQTEKEQARVLCEGASARFGASMGRMHDQKVGPHPRASCQLAFGPDQLGPLLAWLVLNRHGLTVFVHAETGDVVKDHTDHVLWLGPSETIDLTALH